MPLSDEFKELISDLDAPNIIPKTPTEKERFRDLDPFLQEVAEADPTPTPITSTIRTQKENQRVGGAANSGHLHGTALDISLQGLSPEQVQQKLEYYRSQGIAADIHKRGTAPHIHVELPGKRNAKDATFEELIEGLGGPPQSEQEDLQQKIIDTPTLPGFLQTAGSEREALRQRLGLPETEEGRRILGQRFDEEQQSDKFAPEKAIGGLLSTQLPPVKGLQSLGRLDRLAQILQTGRSEEALPVLKGELDEPLGLPAAKAVEEKTGVRLLSGDPRLDGGVVSGPTEELEGGILRRKLEPRTPLQNMVREFEADIVTSPSTILGAGVGRGLTKIAEKASQIKDIKKLVSSRLASKLKEVVPSSAARNQIDRIALANSDIGTTSVIDPLLPAVNLKGKSFGKAKRILSSIGEGFATRLKKLGPAGESLADSIQRVEEKSIVRIGKAERIAREGLKSLTDNELDNFVDVLGGGRPINSRVIQSVKKIKPLLDEVADEAEKKIPGFVRRKNFFPHQHPKEVIDTLLKDKDFVTREAARLHKLGRFDSMLDAEAQVKKLIRANLEDPKLLGRKAGPLDFQRLKNLPGWSRDPKTVLPRYFKQAYRRLAEVDEYGVADENLNKLLQQISDAYDTDVFSFVNEGIKKTLSDYKNLDFTAQELSKFGRAFSVVTKMSFGQITNTGQTANTLIKTGFRPTLKALAQVFKKNQRAFARDSGALVDTITEELSAGVSLSEAFLKYTGFKGVETFNRLVAAVAGRNYIQHHFGILLKATKKGRFLAKLQQKTSLRHLKELGVNTDEALKRGFLTDAELKRGAFRVVKSTQFTTRPQDLPLLWSSPLGKLLSQFKSFALQHGRFMKTAIYEEAKKGNVLPLLRTAIAVSTIGEVVFDVKSVTRGKNPFKDRADLPFLERQMENFFQLGAFGLMSDMIEATKFGPSAILRSVAGPTVSTAAELVEPVARTTAPLLGFQLPTEKQLTREGKRFGRSALKQVPAAGRFISREVLPTKRQQKKKKKKSKSIFGKAGF